MTPSTEIKSVKTDHGSYENLIDANDTVSLQDGKTMTVAEYVQPKEDESFFMASIKLQRIIKQSKKDEQPWEVSPELQSMVESYKTSL